jgi:hypothetical protein
MVVKMQNMKWNGQNTIRFQTCGQNTIVPLKNMCNLSRKMCKAHICSTHTQENTTSVCVCLIHMNMASWSVIGVVSALTPPRASRRMLGLPFRPWTCPSSSVSFHPRGKPPERETARIRHENSYWSGAGVTTRRQRTPIRVKIRP